jgi:hypothetical protein
MRTLDMKPYAPYRRMALTCQTRPIQEKQVLWVMPQPKFHKNGCFLGRVLSRRDIEAAAELWRWAYPEVYGSAHDFILFPEEYESRLALAETWDKDSRGKPFCMLVAEEVASGRLVAGTLMTKLDKNLQVEYTFAGTHPEFRRQGLMNLLGSLMHRMALVSGAEYLTTFLETWHTITQEKTLKFAEGWQIAGIFPGNFIRWAGNNQEYRACEVYMYRFINNGDRYATKPAEWSLHPNLEKLWRVLEDINSRIGQISPGRKED